MKPTLSSFLVGLVLCLSRVPASGTIVTVGSRNTKDQVPFGVGSAAYNGDYQQVYASSAFQSTGLITEIAFAYYYPFPDGATYTFSIGLGVTSQTPTSPGDTFSTSYTLVFSGTLRPRFTSESGDFDFPISLTTPFNYDPSRGNLLLDIRVSAASGSSSGLFWVDDQSGSQSANMARIFASNGNTTGKPKEGLVTQFTFSEVPEPSAGVLVLLWAASALICKFLGRGCRATA